MQENITVDAPCPLPPWPSYAPEELEAVQQVLQSGKVNYWTGQECRKFEAEYAKASGCAHAIALSNGTTALELAIHALEIPEGSEIITSARTFIASASSAVAQRCRPIIADVDPNSGNMTAHTIAQAITPKTKAIVAVHLAGWPCDLDPILELARTHGLKVIEDCAQANGAAYKGRPVGSLGDVGAFSFCQDKIITTGGEGGMLTTNDQKVWRRAWEYKDHGKSWDAVHQPQQASGFRWLHETFGTNWRMTEMQAAIGRCQLRKLPQWIEARQRNMEILFSSLDNIPFLRIPRIPPDSIHASYKAYVYVRPEALKEGETRDRIVLALNNAGLSCFTGSCGEIYREKAFTKRGWGPAMPLPVAKMLGETSLMFMIHPTITPEQMAEFSRQAASVMRHFSRY